METNGAIIQRNTSLDAIRALAAFCVVANHTVESVYQLTTDYVSMMSEKAKLFCFTVFTFGRIGVPLFLFLSGYLLLTRAYDKPKISRFYHHNLLPLIIVWEIWIFIYSIFSHTFFSMPFDFASYFRRALFLEHGGLPHTWYMPMIIGMYLFIPYVALAIQKMNKKTLWIIMSALYIYLFIIPCLNLLQNIMPVPFLQGSSKQIDLSYGGNTYGLYLAVGYCIARYQKRIDSLFNRRRHTAYLLFGGTGIVLFAGTISVQLKLYSANIAYNVWYDFPTLPIIGICMFIPLMQIKWRIPIQSIWFRLSSCAFGIYLLHELILIPSVQFIGEVPYKSIKVVLISITTYLLSFLSVEMLSMVPYINHLFLKKHFHKN